MATEYLREAFWGESRLEKLYYSKSDYETRQLKLAPFRQGKVGEFLHPFFQPGIGPSTSYPASERSGVRRIIRPRE